MKKTIELEKIKQRIIKDGVCGDLADNASQLVFGWGNPDADIVFIGEAPGKNEDKTGQPFVGSAGKFFDEMLGNIGLDRQDVYITNIVKYRPPENRDPSQSEKEEFLPYLLEEIEIVNPVLIITLGRHSMSCFLPEEQIGQVHGQIIKKSGNLFVPLYHPAAALYNGAMRQILIEDFNKIPDILENTQSLIKKKEKIKK